MPMRRVLRGLLGTMTARAMRTVVTIRSAAKGRARGHAARAERHDRHRARDEGERRVRAPQHRERAPLAPREGPQREVQQLPAEVAEHQERPGRRPGPVTRPGATSASATRPSTKKPHWNRNPTAPKKASRSWRKARPSSVPRSTGPDAPDARRRLHSDIRVSICARSSPLAPRAHDEPPPNRSRRPTSRLRRRLHGGAADRAAGRLARGQGRDLPLRLPRAVAAARHGGVRGGGARRRRGPLAPAGPPLALPRRPRGRGPLRPPPRLLVGARPRLPAPGRGASSTCTSRPSAPR